ncbi:MAG: endo-1,4-beta-xylanase [Spirochaetota bacterium]
MLKHCAVIFCVCVLSISAEADLTKFAYVTAIRGQVTVASGRSIRKTLAAGDVILMNDNITTAANSELTAGMENFGVFQVRERTTVRIDAMINRKGRLGMNMKKGGILFAMRKLMPSEEIDVTTPAGVVAVRGTSFYVSADSTQSRIAVLTGTVRVTTAAGTVLVPELTETTITRRTAPSPTPIRPETAPIIRAIARINGIDAVADKPVIIENLRRLDGGAPTDTKSATNALGTFKLGDDISVDDRGTIKIGNIVSGMTMRGKTQGRGVWELNRKELYPESGLSTNGNRVRALYVLDVEKASNERMLLDQTVTGGADNFNVQAEYTNPDDLTWILYQIRIPITNETMGTVVRSGTNFYILGTNLPAKENIFEANDLSERTIAIDMPGRFISITGTFTFALMDQRKNWTPKQSLVPMLFGVNKDMRTATNVISFSVTTRSNWVPRSPITFDHASIPSLRETYASYFPLCAGDMSMLRIGKCESILRRHFSGMTAGNAMKWSQIQPKKDAYTFDEADAIAAYASQNAMQLHGHTFIYHTTTPAWVFQNDSGSEIGRDALLDRMREHISTVAKRYAASVTSWDIANEASPDAKNSGAFKGTPWHRIIGDDYIEKAFQYADNALPGVRLTYNDYGQESSLDRIKFCTDLIGHIRKSGGRIDEVGLQMHVNAWVNPTSVETAITALAQAGVKVAISELDVSVFRDNNDGLNNPYANGVPDDILAQQALTYAQLFKLFKKRKDVISRVTFWALYDGLTWLDRMPVQGRKNHPALFDVEGKPKPAFWAVIDPDNYIAKNSFLLFSEQQWSTSTKPGCSINVQGNEAKIIGTTQTNGWASGNRLTTVNTFAPSPFSADIEFMVPVFNGPDPRLVSFGIEGQGVRSTVLLFQHGYGYGMQAIASGKEGNKFFGNLEQIGDESNRWHTMSIRYDGTNKLRGSIDGKSVVGDAPLVLSNRFSFNCYANTDKIGTAMDIRFRNFKVQFGK